MVAEVNTKSRRHVETKCFAVEIACPYMAELMRWNTPVWEGEEEIVCAVGSMVGFLRRHTKPPDAVSRPKSGQVPTSFGKDPRASASAYNLCVCVHVQREWSSIVHDNVLLRYLL
jgi:hypothetical protein